MSVFSDILAKTGQPQAIQDLAGQPLERLYSKIEENNVRVNKISASNDTLNPNNTEHLDAAIELNEDNDPRVAELSAEIAKLNAEKEEIDRKHEIAIKEARELIIPQLKPPMSATEIATTRATFNEVSKEIDNLMAEATTMSTMVMAFLTSAGQTAPEGGILSLLPERKNLTRGAGRKTTGGNSAQGSRITRTDAVLVNGELVFNLENGAKASRLSNAATKLTEMFNGKRFPGNTVTLDEIEHAYYDSYEGSVWRQGATMPVHHTFTFTKEVQVQNPNDDGTTPIPQHVKIDVIRNVKSVENIKEGNTAKAKFGLPLQEVPESKEEDKPEVDTQTAEAQVEEVKSKSEESTPKIGPATQKLLDAKTKREGK